MKIIVTDGLAHRVQCGNILDPDVDYMFSDGRKARVFYCDPPWGDAMMKLFATMATKDTGIKFDPSGYEALEARMFQLIERHVYGHVFIETGLRWEAGITARMQALGLKSLSSVKLRYGQRGENVLLYGTFLAGTPVRLSPLAGMKGPPVPVSAIAQCSAPGEIVFDPCCGLGLSARAARLNGMEFRGNELNPKRLDRTIARLT